MLELRAGGTLTAQGKTLTGYAAVFNSEAPLPGFMEVIRQGAFAKSLATGSNIRALWHHQTDALLGTTRGGTLKLHEDAKGLRFELALPDTTHGRDLAILVDRGDVTGCSFGFRVAEGGDRWEQRGAQLVRELLAVDLHEITLTHDPAYQDTSVALRSMPSLGTSPNLARLWLETCT
jgi:HK97 family phage prohead protease